MYFDTIEIIPVHPMMQKKGEPKWRVLHCELDHDREPEQHPPHSLGFWHYDRSIGVKKAFEILKQDMIDRRNKEVEILLNDIAELEELEYKEKK